MTPFEKSDRGDPCGSPPWPRGGLLGIFLASIASFPLLSALADGRPVASYLDFPPRPVPIGVALPFRGDVAIVLVLLAAGALALLLWPVARELRGARRTRRNSFGKERSTRTRAARFPLWGWLGAALTAAAWYAAWTRPELPGSLDRHTFTSLWLGYVLLANALCAWRGGLAPLQETPRVFWRLFPLSAGFWWVFEYLNRFVGNWHYLGVEDEGRWAYFLHATFAFATVLPAVLSTAALLATFRPLDRAYRDLRVPGLRGASERPGTRDSHATSLTLLGLSWLGLFAVGWRPELTYPLVWLAPFGTLVALHLLAHRPTPFRALREGDWRAVALFALASLLCGFLWEMWNFWSWPKWRYTVPWVDTWHLFEMPALGYAGYLPFGLECLLACWLLPGARLPWRDPPPPDSATRPETPQSSQINSAPNRIR